MCSFDTSWWFLGHHLLFELLPVILKLFSTSQSSHLKLIVVLYVASHRLTALPLDKLRRLSTRNTLNVKRDETGKSILAVDKSTIWREADLLLLATIWRWNFPRTKVAEKFITYCITLYGSRPFNPPPESEYEYLYPPNTSKDNQELSLTSTNRPTTPNVIEQFSLH